MNNNGLLLCRIQAELFANYTSYSDVAPYFFITRFMHSDLAKRFDDTTVLLESSSIETFISELDEQYGKPKNKTKNKIDKEVLYWVGYVYRYWAIEYNVSSKTLISNVNPNILINRYYLYHSMDLNYLIERICEEENIHIPPQKTVNDVVEEYLKFINSK